MESNFESLNASHMSFSTCFSGQGHDEMIMLREAMTCGSQYALVTAGVAYYAP